MKLRLVIKIIELKPDYAEVYSNMGTLYLKLKRENEAELSYKKAIELNPNFTDAFKYGGCFKT